jgi:pimeloyl-ACP methyl ester carboxylesterase
LIIYPNVYTNLSLEIIKNKYCDHNSKFINIDGIEVHYKKIGSGHPLVLLHGTGSSLHTWKFWKDDLAKNYEVIVIDLPSFWSDRS